jgi:hypothetical protein
LLKEAAHHLYEHSQEYNHKAPHDLVARIKALLYNAEAEPQPTQLAEFEQLLEDLEGAVAETAVFNATRRSMTVRMVRPRREKLVAFFMGLLKKRRMKIVGYVMKHKTGPDQGFMWLSERNSKLFSEDWTRVPAYIEVENNETKADA